MSDGRTRRLSPMLVALLLTTAPAAQASDDGGTTSVFAFGAGNRALALGGAYAAIADDASAPVWNPAGLGYLERREFQASGASLYGLDINEEFASLVLPTWRWGVAAATFRRFAVGDIEQRDADNLVVPGELEDLETEFMLSYARAASAVWSAGGSLKMQRQSLAGYSANGIGLDFGVLVRPALLWRAEAPWAGRLHVGLALHNLVEPSLQLDRESIHDPTRIRAGLAYRHPLPNEISLLAAMDAEKVTAAGTKLHAGVEAAFRSLLALRAGWNADYLTAGAGVQWHGVAFDYVFEDNDIETVHRFGMTLRFGATVAEKRAAALQQEEEAFRRRLAESFREREASRVNELVAQAERDLDESRFDDALTTLATASALAPEDARVRGLEARALKGKAALRERAGEYATAALLYGQALAIVPGDAVAAEGLVRCRSTSDRLAERSERIRNLFAAALDSFAAGELPAARQHLLSLLEIDPADADARAMLARTESALQARMQSLLAQMNRFLDKGLLAEAEELIDQVRVLSPDSPELAAATERLAQAEREARRREAAARRAAAAPPTDAAGETVAADGPPANVIVAKGPVLSKKKQREIADLYQRGIQAMDAERPDDALRYWELVWLADPDYQNVAEFLKREYLLRGLDAFSRGQLDDAISLWESALNVDPQDEKTLGYLARAREQATRTREILGAQK